MISTMRENARAIREASCNGIVRRMVSLPRSIIGGLSRAMGHGIDLIGIGGRRHNRLQLATNFQLPQHPQEPVVVPDEWAFLTSFEQQYGSTHPFFYACEFMEALKIAADEHKFMFIYLHSPQHPFTPPFCRETLSSELLIQFLDANFISWGALADRGEGLQMVATLGAASFPFCAVVAPAPGNSNTVLLQIAIGSISPAELVEILQGTLEEQGLAFGGGGDARAKEQERIRARAREEEKIRADRQLREEQDSAYLAAIQIDKEKEKFKHLPSVGRVQKPVEASNKASHDKFSTAQKQYGNAKLTPSKIRETQQKDTTNNGKDPQVTQILIRFPNGERREQSFMCTDKIQSIYRYIDSLGTPGTGNYKLISSFPRRVYGVDQMGITLKDAGLHPRATLLLELQ